MSAPGGEQAFVERLRRMLPPAPAGQHWIGDDAAVLADGLLLETDVVVEGIHFDLEWCEPEDVGWKALAVNLSDIAAMAGTATAAVVALVVPPDRPGVADRTMAGVAEAAAQLGCPVVGGDTSSGPALTVAVAVLGRVSRNGPVLRSGARPGDLVVVTGELGVAASALAAIRRGATAPAGIDRLRRPTPRLAEGIAAAELGATAMVDLSDGLVTDLRRVCRESGCAAVIEEVRLPPSAHADLDTALFGGDDYELLFTIPPDRAGDLRGWQGTPVTTIGVMTSETPRVTLEGPHGGRELTGGGFEHPIAGPLRPADKGTDAPVPPPADR